MIKVFNRLDFIFPYQIVKDALNKAEYEEDKLGILEDLTFLRLYLYKCMNALTCPEEVIEYCSEEFLKQLNNAEYIDGRIYPLSSLQKDKYFEIIHYYNMLSML